MSLVGWTHAPCSKIGGTLTSGSALGAFNWRTRHQKRLSSSPERRNQARQKTAPIFLALPKQTHLPSFVARSRPRSRAWPPPSGAPSPPPRLPPPTLPPPTPPPPSPLPP